MWVGSDNCKYSAILTSPVFIFVLELESEALTIHDISEWLNSYGLRVLDVSYRRMLRSWLNLNVEIEESVLFFFNACSLLLFTYNLRDLFSFLSDNVELLGCEVLLGIMINGSILKAGSNGWWGKFNKVYGEWLEGLIGRDFLFLVWWLSSGFMSELLNQSYVFFIDFYADL